MNPESCGIDLCKIPDIPHAVVDTRYEDGKDLLRKYPGAYVTVRDENAVYHVSKPGYNCLPNAVSVSRNPIYRDNYDPERDKRYKMNTVYDFLNNKAYVFDNDGDVRVITMEAA